MCVCLYSIFGLQIANKSLKIFVYILNSDSSKKVCVCSKSKREIISFSSQHINIVLYLVSLFFFFSFTHLQTTTKIEQIQDKMWE